MTQNFDIGDILARTFRYAFRNFGTFAALAAIFLSPMFALSLWQATVFGDPSMASDPAALMKVGAISLAIVPISIALSNLATAATSFGVFRRLRQQRATVGECLSAVVGWLLPVIGVALLVTLISVVGLVMLIIPGIIFYIMLSVALPAALMERIGVIAALERSYELTQGYRWQIFAVFVLLVLIGIALMIPLGILSVVATIFLPPVVSVGIQWVGSLISTIFQATAITVIYHDLRVIKEKFNVEDIAAVFD